MKSLLKKFNNFRLTAFVLACIAILGILVTVLFFVAYQTTSNSNAVITIQGTEYVVKNVLFAQRDTTVLHNAFPDRPVLGFVFFMAAFLAIILGVASVAFALPFIMPKEKGVPSKTIAWVVLAQQVFVLVIVVLGAIAIVTSKRDTYVLTSYIDEYGETAYKRIVVSGIETVYNKPFWIIDIALGVIVIALGAFMIYPNIKCNFYCPEIPTEAEIKARKEAKKAAKEARKAEAAAQ